MVPGPNISRNGGATAVYWPEPATGYVLDQLPTLSGSPLPWILVPVNTYQTNGNTISVIVPAGPNNQFFRLRKP